jgi:hypothetical protein
VRADLDSRDEKTRHRHARVRPPRRGQRRRQEEADGQGKLDQILTKDVAGKEIGSSITIVGYGNPVGLVRSMSVSKNCVLAWGELVTDAAGTSTYRVRSKAFGAASDVTEGIVNEIATVGGPDDIAHVSIKADGRKVTVRWTQGGVPQTKVLPG